MDRQGNLCEVALVMEDLSESDKYWEGRNDSECRYPEDIGFRWEEGCSGTSVGREAGMLRGEKVSEMCGGSHSIRMKLEDAYPPRDIEKGEKVGPEMTALHPS